MQSVVLGLVCISSLLPPSFVAGNALRPNHAAPELLVIPNNVTIMTPRDMSSVFERQAFDFGSPSSSEFWDFRRLTARQACAVGLGLCPNDLSTCCQLGGDCCGGGTCCRRGSFCYGGGCCLLTKVGCDNRVTFILTDRDAATLTRIAAWGEDVALMGAAVQLSMANLGVVQTGKPASAILNVAVPVIPVARMKTSAAVSTGNTCYRDRVTNEPLCHDPYAQTSTTVASVSSSIQTSTFKPPSETRTAFTQSQSTTNVGAIAGGTVAGVVALVGMIIFFVIWRRKKSSEGPDAETPTAGPGDKPSHNHAYSPDTVPPTPGTADPFLTPMSQHPNPGVSYFTGAVDRPLSGTSSTPHYTGLPEPHHGNDMGAKTGTTAMPVPRHDTHHPHSIPMIITPLQTPSPDSPSVILGPGSDHEAKNTSSVYSNLPSAINAYSPTPPPREPLTVHQPSSEGGGHNGNSDMYSPPPESLYPRAFAGNVGGLPGGAAPPPTGSTPAEE